MQNVAEHHTKHAQGRALQHSCMPHRQAARLSAHLSSQCVSGPTAKDADTNHKTQTNGTPDMCACMHSLHWAHIGSMGRLQMTCHLSKMNVLGEVSDAGPTSMRSRSPGVPASTGHGVKDTGRKANSPFLSLSGIVPTGLSKYTPVAGSSKTCRSWTGNDEDVVLLFV